MAYLNPNSFYSSVARRTAGKPAYQAPQSSAFGGTLGAPKPPAAPTPAAAAPAASGGSSASSTLPPGFTATQGGLPPDPVYQAAISALSGTRDNTVTGLGQQRTAGLLNYGYNETTGPDGKPQITFDPNNPYSQAALLRKHYQNAKVTNRDSYAASGHLYGGGLQNAQEAAADSYGASDNALTQAVQNFLAQNTIQTNAAKDAYNTGAAGALATSVQNAPNSPLYNSAASGSGGVYSTANDGSGNYAITAANGPVALVDQPKNGGVVKLANGWSIVYSADGKTPLYWIDPQGNKQGG